MHDLMPPAAELLAQPANPLLDDLANGPAGVICVSWVA